MSYVFCRISTGRGCSLDYQEALIRKAAGVAGSTIKEVIKHIGSAYKETPKALLHLSATLKHKKIMFYCVDRFSRNYNQGLQLAMDFLKNQNVLYFVVENLLVQATVGAEWDKFCKLLADAETESQKISRRVTDAKDHLTSQGYFTGSVAPFGYKKVKLLNGYVKIEVDPNTDQIVRFIKECKTPGVSVEQLNNTLAKCGGNTEAHPIILDGDSDVLETDLRFENIATLLNDYNILGGPWSSAKVSRVYHLSKLDKFNIKDEKLNINTKSKTQTQKNVRSSKRKHSDVFDD